MHHFLCSRKFTTIHRAPGEEPRSLVKMLEAVFEDFPDERLIQLFSSGTIDAAYQVHMWHT